MIKICCINCLYYWADCYKGFCTIDKQDIPPDLSHIFKCKAFDEWWGAIE